MSRSDQILVVLSASIPLCMTSFACSSPAKTLDLDARVLDLRKGRSAGLIIPLALENWTLQTCAAQAQERRTPWRPKCTSATTLECTDGIRCGSTRQRYIPCYSITHHHHHHHHHRMHACHHHRHGHHHQQQQIHQHQHHQSICTVVFRKWCIHL